MPATKFRHIATMVRRVSPCVSTSKPSSPGAHGVTHPTRRLMESLHLQPSDAHGDHEPPLCVWCPRFSVFRPPDTLKGGHQTLRFMESLHLQRADAHRGHERPLCVWCPRFSVFRPPDALKGGHQTLRFMERGACPIQTLSDFISSANPHSHLRITPAATPASRDVCLAAD